eukprot:gene313-351_t
MVSQAFSAALALFDRCVGISKPVASQSLPAKPEPPMSVNAQVLAIAGRWIGTPYRHQGAVKGVGCDCLGLVRGIWRELYGAEPEAVPAYAPDWAERAGEERLMAAAGRHFVNVPSFDESLPGDLVLFRFR